MNFRIVLATAAFAFLFYLTKSYPSWVEHSQVFAPPIGDTAVFLQNELPLPRTTPLAFFLALVIISASLGYSVMSSTLFRVDDSRVFKLSASFPVGYLIAVAVHRLVSLFFPLVQSGLISMGILGALCVVVNFNSKRLRPLDLKVALRESRSLFFIALTTSIFAVFQVQQGKHFVAGDATVFSLKFLESVQHLLKVVSLPIVNQHYDELTFISYLLPFAGPGKAVGFYFLLLNSIFKVTVGAFLYVLNRAFGLKNVQNVLLLAFLYFGSTSIDPRDYVLMFDSANPLFLNFHPGRLLSFALPIFLAWTASQADSTYQVSQRYKALWFLFGIGCASIVMHVMIYSFAAIFFVYALRYRSTSELEGGLLRNTLVLFLVFAATYIQRNNAIAFVLSVTSIGTALLLTQLDLAKLKGIAKVAWLRNFASGWILASIFLGNLLTAAIAKYISLIAHELGIPDVWESILVRPVMNPKRPIAFVSKLECNPPQYCASVSAFLAHFGLVIILACASLYFYSNRHLLGKEEEKFGGIRGVDLCYMLTIWIVVLLFASIFRDFVQTSFPEWYASRLQETPFYFVLWISLFSLFKVFEQRRYARIFYSFMVLWIVVPFFSNQRLGQFFENLKFFYSSLRS